MRFFSPDLKPKLVSVLSEGYGRHELSRDVLSGIVVGIVALPLAIAFGIASGVRPEQGLYTAIIAGFIISAMGGSRVQIGGPTGAFVILVAGVVGEFGYQGLAVATFMAGVFLILMGLARLGDVIRFIPYPVTVGFTSGIALIIASGQVADALGLDMASVPASFLDKFAAYSEHIGSINPAAVIIFLVTIGVILVWTRVPGKMPGMLMAVIATTLLVQVFDLNVDTIQSRFGDVPRSLPSFHWLDFEWKNISVLVSAALSIALLGGIESLLSAVVSDGQIGGRHRSNAELVAQGVANMVSPLFGGIPATGAIARTATNVKNGGLSPIAGMVHALTLLIILVVAGKWASLIPMATLAGILAVVAYNMSEWHAFVGLLKGPKSDVLVLVATFVLTVAIDLVVAIQVGVVLAALLFMRRMAEVTQVKPIHDMIAYETETQSDQIPVDLPDGVELFEINGSFCFGAARKFTETFLNSTRTSPVVILRMRHVLAIDATGIHALEDVAERLQKRGSQLVISGIHAQPLVALDRSGFLDAIGRENVCGSISDALERARNIA